MPHIAPLDLLPIGDLARRAGVSVPTVRDCEERGLTLQEIAAALANCVPTARQLEAHSKHCSPSLDGCIGCGCLSLRTCALFNPEDEAAGEGPVSRWLRKADAVTD